MRRSLGALAVLGALVLAGCGDDTAGGEADKEPRGPVEFELVEMVTETNVGGLVSPGAVPLADISAVQNFTGQFDDDRMATRLTQVLDGLKVPEDQAAYGAVVALGCEVPPDVTVTSTDSGILIEGTAPSEKPVECVAAMTTVAVVLVDESVVG
jgi:hypothetical protein